MGSFEGTWLVLATDINLICKKLLFFLVLGEGNWNQKEQLKGVSRKHHGFLMRPRPTTTITTTTDATNSCYTHREQLLVVLPPYCEYHCSYNDRFLHSYALVVSYSHHQKPHLNCRMYSSCSSSPLLIQKGKCPGQEGLSR